MENIRIKCHAKVNFCLKITGLCENGYHEIDTVAASIGIYDRISIRLRQDNEIKICCPGIENEKNTAYLAALLFCETFRTRGCDILVEKGIPLSAGLGGSSADAAGVIYALGALYGIKPGKYGEVARRCGSDTYYMLEGGFSRLKGTGDIAEPFKCGKIYDIVVAKPGKGVSSADSYKKYDELKIAHYGGSEPENAVKALKSRDYPGLLKYCVNDLLQPSSAIVPEITTVLALLKNSGAEAAFMSGSGSACIGIYKNASDAAFAAERINEKGYFAVNTQTVNKGIEII